MITNHKTKKEYEKFFCMKNFSYLKKIKNNITNILFSLKLHKIFKKTRKIINL